MIVYKKESKDDSAKIEEEEPTESRELELGLNSNSVFEIYSLKAMKFFGEIKGRQVLVLLDNGVTHNVLSDRVMKELNILINPTQFVVVLGDDRKIWGVGKWEMVELAFQGIKVVQDLFPFKLGGVDVILGVH